MLNMRGSARVAVFAVAAGGLVWPVSALLAATDKLQIEVTGNIKPYCTSSVTSNAINVGDVTKAGSGTLSFTVDCNTPFQYTLQSDNGAMRLVNPPAAAKPNQIETPYDVHIKIPLTLGGEINDTCSSAAIKQGAVSCKFSNSGQKVAVNKTAETRISWKDAQSILAAGQYSDRLTITVGVRI